MRLVPECTGCMHAAIYSLIEYSTVLGGIPYQEYQRRRVSFVDISCTSSLHWTGTSLQYKEMKVVCTVATSRLDKKIRVSV